MPGESTQTLEIAGHTVVIAYDTDAGVWYLHSSTVPGLVSEGASASELAEELEVTVRALSMP